MPLAIFIAIVWLVGGIAGSAVLWLIAVFLFADSVDSGSGKEMLAAIGVWIVGVVWAVIWIWQTILSVLHVIGYAVGVIH